MPKKKRIKIWWCSCACCGYLCTSQICTGAGDSLEKDVTERVVKNLVLPHFSAKGYVVYADNYFTSFHLCKDLLKESIYLTSIIRSSSSECPKKLKNTALLPSMNIIV